MPTSEAWFLAQDYRLDNHLVGGIAQALGSCLLTPFNEMVYSMKTLTNFNAVYCSGLFVPSASAVSAIALLFEKVYLPNNLEFIKAFAQKYRINVPEENREIINNLRIEQINLHDAQSVNADPFKELTKGNLFTAYAYIHWGMEFALKYQSLFGEVFDTDLFDEGKPLEVKLVKEGKLGELNTYNVRRRPMKIVEGDEGTFPKLIQKGYIPLVGKFGLPDISNNKNIDNITAKQLSALLAMKSVEMMFPSTKPVHPEVILEARDKLRDHLPPYWSAMFKLTTDLKTMIKDSKTNKDIVREGQDMVDTIVRPALIDLNDKLEKERKNWFYKILAPMVSGVKIMLGNPPVTQQQLLTNALVLGADVTMSTIGNMKRIDALKNEAGLTFLLDLSRIIEKHDKKNG